jgi:tRNA threonylcarbamoyl adenosine modification protein YeaZ
MNILAFDTTHGYCSVAIATDHKPILSTRIEETSRQAELLIPTIESLLTTSGLHYSDLDVLAVTTGPGSFTGVRIGLAAAQGLILSTSMRFFGVSGLQAVAWHAKKSEVILQSDIYVILDARRDEVFVQGFHSNDLSPITSLQLCNIKELASIVPEDAYITGNKATLLNQSVSAKLLNDPLMLLPDATSVAGFCLQCLDEGKTGLALEPVYIRKPDAKLPKNPVV